MKLIRTFHPVGHGAFYTERFYNEHEQLLYTAVFDCGCFEVAKPGCNAQFFQNQINTTIQHEFANRDTIDALFISHFHTDHINGVDFLLRHCNIRRIFIPILTPRVILEAFIFNYLQTGSVSNIGNDLLEKLATNIIPNITQIRTHRKNKKESERKKIDITQNNNKYLPPESYLHNPQINWNFIPFNLLDGQINHLLYRKSPLKGFVRNRTVDFDRLRNFISQNTISQLQQIYKQALQVNHNSYSMTVLSCYPHYNTQNAKYQISWNNISNSKSSLINCLYLGDFEASKTYPKRNKNLEELKKYYRRYWTDVGLLQVPHHGSEHNYNDDLYDHQQHCVISYGDTDIYNHPDTIVLNGLQQHQCTLIRVTELSQPQIFTYLNL